MRINSFLANNQNLTPYLARLESLFPTDDFFAKIRSDEKLDPMNFQVRETWLRTEDWAGEYMVVFGRHFNIRACQRIGLRDDVIEAVMQQLSNNEVLAAVTSHPLCWENGEIVSVYEDKYRAVVVLEEGTNFVCIYECGQSYIYPRTILSKSPSMSFHKDQEVIVVTKEGYVSRK